MEQIPSEADTDRGEGFKRQKNVRRQAREAPYWGSQGLRKKEIVRGFKEFPMRTQNRCHSKGQDTLRSGHQEKGDWGCQPGKGESLSCTKAWGRNGIGILSLPLESSSKGYVATCGATPSHTVGQETDMLSHGTKQNKTNQNKTKRKNRPHLRSARREPLGFDRVWFFEYGFRWLQLTNKQHQRLTFKL